ncbi:MAG: hypothetical protein AAF577_14320 [Pseudomonadota bacterium]
MSRTVKVLFRLAILGALALAGYALFAELPAPRQPVSVTITTPDAGSIVGPNAGGEIAGATE